jgi:broad specificity phosphatase PhoE
MKIVIMRHGKPILDLEEIKYQKIPASQLAKIVDKYERTDLDLTNLPHDDTLLMAAECAVSVCSDLPRAISSIKVLGLEKITKIDPTFRESALPYLELKRPKLSFFTWAIIFRLAWLCGFSKNGESIMKAKARAKCGTKILEDFAKEKTAVLHVGHGIMNRLLIKELKRRNWQVKERTSEEYWSYTVLEYKTLQSATVDARYYSPH